MPRLDPVTTYDTISYSYVKNIASSRGQIATPYIAENTPISE